MRIIPHKYLYEFILSGCERLTETPGGKAKWLGFYWVTVLFTSATRSSGAGKLLPNIRDILLVRSHTITCMLSSRSAHCEQTTGHAPSLGLSHDASSRKGEEESRVGALIQEGVNQRIQGQSRHQASLLSKTSEQGTSSLSISAH